MLLECPHGHCARGKGSSVSCYCALCRAHFCKRLQQSCMSFCSVHVQTAGGQLLAGLWFQYPQKSAAVLAVCSLPCLIPQRCALRDAGEEVITDRL